VVAILSDTAFLAPDAEAIIEMVRASGKKLARGPWTPLEGEIPTLR